MDAAVACRLPGVSRSGYYEWKGRPESARASRGKELLKLIEQVHAGSRGSYGSPRVTAELRLGPGAEVNRKRVERLMRQAGIQGIYRRRGRKNLVNAATEEDLVRRDFTADWPDALWLTGITGHPTDEGKRYCAAVMAAFSRKITGWSIAARQDTELVINALSMAVTRRQPEKGKTVLHSGHGTQYTAWAFGKRIRDAGILGSMGTAGDCYDNAMMESFWHTMQLELPDRTKWETRQQLGNGIFEWVECWYNPCRRHSSLGMLSPAEYERRYHEGDPPPSDPTPPVSGERGEDQPSSRRSSG
jgi:putative transposase